MRAGSVVDVFSADRKSVQGLRRLLGSFASAGGLRFPGGTRSPGDQLDSNATVLQGTLDLLIMRAVSRGPMHGWGISQRLQHVSGGVLEVNQGSLYPALHRLVGKRLLSAHWGVSENGRRARYYKLTAAGKRQLAVELSSWRKFSGAVNAMLASG
jgi:PadR family transcriptional regulator PadR